jgi:hypothetical protein
VKNLRILLHLQNPAEEVTMSSNCEEMIQLAEALTNETDTEKLLQLSEALLHALDKMESEKHQPVDAA